MYAILFVVVIVAVKADVFPIRAPTRGLCDHMGFNPHPGDCTKFVHCWMAGSTVQSVVQSCPFGQFWDVGTITCRPSFLVSCIADPCKQAQVGFTYGMTEYGCRSYWKCINGFSVGHCCPTGSTYVEGIGCLNENTCQESCPPRGVVAVKHSYQPPVCDKKAHWDPQYYIQIIDGLGEVIRPCPLGTIFREELCYCDFELTERLSTTRDDRNCNVPGDVVFVIDGSNSISDVDFVRLKTFVANLIDTFEINTNAINVGMVVYSTLVSETIGLSPPKNKMVLKFIAMNLRHPKLGTDTAAGIEAGRQMISTQGRPQASKIIVVITDGRSTDPSSTIIQANMAKAQGVTMIAIGVGSDIDTVELQQIASTPAYVQTFADFQSMANTVNVISNLICTSITTTSTTFIDSARTVSSQHFVCNKKAHWDRRYYIEIIGGQGEVIRPCPVGTTFNEGLCFCELLPTKQNG